MEKHLCPNPFVIRTRARARCKLILWTVLPAILLTLSCSSPARQGEPGSEIEGSASAVIPRGKGLETIAIVGTNDIHGALVPMSLKTREDEGAAPMDYQAGGVAWLASYLGILREEFGSRLIWLDGGDEFQGSIESNSEKGAPMVSFFNQASLHAAAVGNHEFDFGPETPGSTDLLGALKARMSEAKYPYLAANIVEKASRRRPPFPNFGPSYLASAGALRLGIIGLSTLDTPKTTHPKHIRDLVFTDLKEAVLREARSLREDGAHAIVITAHVGLRCETGRVTPAHTIRRPGDPLGECGSSDEMVKLLRSLPEGTVDAVVSGHSHQVVHHWVAGVPVIQGGAFGRYFNVIYLTYDWNQRRIVPEHSRIEGPVPVCPAIFSNQRDCNGERKPPRNGRGPLVPHEFHGKRITIDPGTRDFVEKVVARTAPVKTQLIAQAARRIDHKRFEESELGNLVSDAIRDSVHAQVSLVNSGGLRSPLEQGAITYGDIFRALPFENVVVTVRLTGKELKLLLRIAESGSRGFAGVSGVNLRLVDPKVDAPSDDLDGSSSIEPWEINRLIEARMRDGSPIDDEREYTLATLDFLAYGGDDLGWFFSRLPASRFNFEAGKVMREAVIEHIRRLAAHGPLNSANAPLIAPDQPRLKFEKPTKAKAGKKKKRKRKKVSGYFWSPGASPASLELS